LLIPVSGGARPGGTGGVRGWSRYGAVRGGEEVGVSLGWDGGLSLWRSPARWRGIFLRFVGMPDAGRRSGLYSGNLILGRRHSLVRGEGVLPLRYHRSLYRVLAGALTERIDVILGQSQHTLQQLDSALG